MVMSVQDTDSFSIWGEHAAAEGKIVQLRLGPLSLQVQAVQNEIRVAQTYSDCSDSDKPADEVPEDSSWSRWALKSKVEKFRCSPCFPDRSVVMKPEHPLKLKIGANVKIYVRIPVSVRILAAGDASTVVEVPSVILSNTWFGNFTDGELCYWISSSARREPVIDPGMPHLVICPVGITNTAGEDLILEKLRLRVEALPIYRADNQLWASETKVYYRGGAEASQVEIVQGVPQEASEGELMAPALNPVRKRFQVRSFGKTWNLAGLGFLND
jgi:hypothetical protein